MAVRPEEIASILRQQIEQFGGAITAVDVGTVVESGDGIARVHGLRGCMYSELLEFPNGVMGMSLNLEEDTVGAIVLGDHKGIREGDEVRSTGRIVQVPVGDGLIGRVVDPLGQPLDGKGSIKSDKARPVAPSGSRSARASSAVSWPRWPSRWMAKVPSSRTRPGRWSASRPTW